MSERHRTWLVIGGGFALAVATVLVLVLSLQNRALRTELGALRQRDLGVPYPGMVVPTFAARPLNDAAETDDTMQVGETQDRAGAQVLFLFRSTCPHCAKTLPYWKAIVQRIREEGLPGVVVYGLSKEPPADVRRYAREERLSFPVARFPSEKMARLYGAVGVPITVVLDGEGRVTYSRIGALTTTAAVDSVVVAVRETVAAASPEDPVETLSAGGGTSRGASF